MFGVIGKKITEDLPQPPSAEEILQDLEIAGPDDIVFTTDIVQLNGEIEQTPALQGNLQLKKRFEVSLQLFLKVLTHIIFQSLKPFKPQLIKYTYFELSMNRNFKSCYCST